MIPELANWKLSATNSGLASLTRDLKVTNIDESFDKATEVFAILREKNVEQSAMINIDAYNLLIVIRSPDKTMQAQQIEAAKQIESQIFKKYI